MQAHESQLCFQGGRAMAAARDLAGSFQDEVTCSICLEYFTDPVTIECGHNCCRACISRCWGESETNFPCPQCRKPAQQRHLRPNKQLGNLVELVKCLRGQAVPGPQEGKVCERHQEPLKLFCGEDQTPICVICRESRAHRAHTVAPIEEAAQEYRSPCLYLQEQILSRLQHVREEKEELQGLKSTWDKECKRLLVGALPCRFCEQLHQFVAEQERLLLARLGELDEEIGRRQEENATHLCKEISRLSALITELEGKCQQPAPELLQVRRCQMCLEPSAGRGRPCPALTLTLSPVGVTLDPDTAHPNLVLSEDRKRARQGHTCQDLPDNPERFDTYLEVLGAEGFTGGRRYWEVEVGNKPEWDLGVCRDSVSRKGKITLTPGNGYWVMRLSNGKYSACTAPLTPLPVSIKPSRVGIFLDYEAGEVSFYNVTDRSRVFTFTDTFSGTLRPYFYTGYNKGNRNVAPLIICPVPAQTE
uniref:E3 ubiquitin-protein ligase TRIM39-like n=1 Tax=Pelusios castaneus TaxID=367368 RepID=A0A8C8RKN7_9SAUR